MLSLNEIVKYDNRMNLLRFKGMTKIDMNIFMSLCSRMKDKGEEEIEMTFEEIKTLSRYTSTDKNDFLRALDDMIQRLQKVNSKIITDDEICYFVLFPTFKINAKTELVKIGVNKDFVFLLNELKAFTRFELAEFVELDSKYTKNLYRLLKQFRTTGKFVVDDIADFKERLDSPKSYEIKDFKRFVLDVAIKELQEKEVFKNLICEPVKAKKRGSPVVGYTFVFEPEQIVHKAIEQQSEPKKATKQTSKKSTELSQKPTTHMTKSAESFNNYPQRQYTKEELDDLESKLLALAVQGE